MNKICILCNKNKNINCFGINNESWRKDGRENRCKDCLSERSKKYRKDNPGEHYKTQKKYYRKNLIKVHTKEICNNYKISLEEYEKIVLNQNGKCAICGKEETRTRNGKTRRLCLDHNHQTGQVRKLLCCACNSILGFSKENIEILYKTIEYLQLFNKSTEPNELQTKSPS